MSSLWLAILQRTHELGELFTVGLHPERIGFCQGPLTAILTRARSLVPAVWIARLDEIATWWKARTGTGVVITNVDQTRFRVSIEGPEGITPLVRAVQVDAPFVPWADGYHRVNATEFTFQASVLPFVGLSPSVSSELESLLRQQGYIVQVTDKQERYAYYFDQNGFLAGSERSLLVQLEKGDRPLIRLGRWPDGARSALSVTGDIDCLTLWDYVLRPLEKSHL
jgi:hypothetical protein